MQRTEVRVGEPTIGANGRRFAFQYHCAEVEHVDVVADAEHERDVVVDEEHRRAGRGDVANPRAEAPGVGRVETGLAQARAIDTSWRSP